MFNPLKSLFQKRVPALAADAAAKRPRVSPRYPYRKRVIRYTLGKSPMVKRTPFARRAVRGFRIYAFIDSQNLNQGVLSQGGKLDFQKFREYLKLKHGVTKAFLFIGYVEEHKPLYEYLKKSGYICVFKKVIEYKDKDIATKGNIDADLVLHTMIEFPNYDKAIIVSGDGDFYPLIEYLKKKGKLLKIITPNKRYSSLLLKFLPDIISMEL